MGAQKIGTERAIQSDSERFSVPDCGPKRFDCVPRKVSTRHVGDGHRYHQRHVAPARGSRFLRRHRCAFGIEGIEYCFDQQKIDTAFDQGIALRAIDIFQIVKVYLAIAWIVDIR